MLSVHAAYVQATNIQHMVPGTAAVVPTDTKFNPKALALRGAGQPHGKKRKA